MQYHSITVHFVPEMQLISPALFLLQFWNPLFFFLLVAAYAILVPRYKFPVQYRYDLCTYRTPHRTRVARRRSVPDIA
eukprot:3939641-Rhodomonas_salina.1